MKKFIFTLCFVIISLCSFGQSDLSGTYSKIYKYDKYDDIVYSIDKKSILTFTNINDSIFVLTVDTKGEEAKQYLIKDYCFDNRDEETDEKYPNILSNMYGYDYIFPVIFDISKGYDEYIICKELYVRKIYSYKYKSTAHQTVTIIWIKFDDGSKLLYRRDY